MRIGFATDVYLPYVSGVTHYVSLNCRYLEQHGHEAFVFSFSDPRTPPHDPHHITSPGLKVRGTSGYHIGPRFTRGARHIMSSMDVVVVDNPFLSGRLALTVCRQLGIPTVFVNHTRVDIYADYYATIVPAALRDGIVRRRLQKFCRQVDLVLSPSQGMYEVLRGMGIDTEIEVVPNGVDIARFLSVPRGFGAAERLRVEHRLELGLAADDVVFVYSGRLGPEKNLTLLVDAFAIVARDVPNAKLVFIGGGPEQRRIESAVAHAGLSGRVKFTGMVPYEKIAEYLAPCDVWVSPSVSEVHPLTIIEAMATGLPIVGVASTGVSDTVSDGRDGLLAPVPEANALAAEMMKLATSADLRREMGLAAREAAKRYAIDSTGAQMLGIYELLACKARERRAAEALKAQQAAQK
jgi:glycosyltransferase involved in cell wall biosynthesis